MNGLPEGIRVYIAGPYTGGDPAENTARAMAAWHTVADLGAFGFCPHLSHFLHIQRQRRYDEWTRHDLEWLRVCHLLWRLPGESSGSDTEVKWAERWEIPVVYSRAEVERFIQARAITGAGEK